MLKRLARTDGKDGRLFRARQACHCITMHGHMLAELLDSEASYKRSWNDVRIRLAEIEADVAKIKSKLGLP